MSSAKVPRPTGGGLESAAPVVADAPPASGVTQFPPTQPSDGAAAVPTAAAAEAPAVAAPADGAVKTIPLSSPSSPQKRSKARAAFGCCWTLLLAISLLVFAFVALDTLATLLNVATDRRLDEALLEKAAFSQTLDQAALQARQPLGEVLASEGFHARHPLVFIPGVVSTPLEVWKAQPCMKKQLRQRIWGDQVMIQKVLLNPWCWLDHIKLNVSNGWDPEGVKLRSASGIRALESLAGAYALWGAMFDAAASIEYDESSMAMLAYDWRLNFGDLERRDGFLSHMKTTIEALYERNNRTRSVIVAHSMGNLLLSYFNQWVHAPPPDEERLKHPFDPNTGVYGDADDVARAAAARNYRVLDAPPGPRTALAHAGSENGRSCDVADCIRPPVCTAIETLSARSDRSASDESELAALRALLGNYTRRADMCGGCSCAFKSWNDKYIEAVVDTGGPLLGTPKALAAIYSGEMKDAVDVSPVLALLKEMSFLSRQQLLEFFRSLRSLVSMLPMGGDTIWGGRRLPASVVTSGTAETDFVVAAMQLCPLGANSSGIPADLLCGLHRGDSREYVRLAAPDQEPSMPDLSAMMTLHVEGRAHVRPAADAAEAATSTASGGGGRTLAQEVQRAPINDSQRSAGEGAAVAAGSNRGGIHKQLLAGWDNLVNKLSRDQLQNDVKHHFAVVKEAIASSAQNAARKIAETTGDATTAAKDAISAARLSLARPGFFGRLRTLIHTRLCSSQLVATLALRWMCGIHDDTSSLVVVNATSNATARGTTEATHSASRLQEVAYNSSAATAALHADGSVAISPATTPSVSGISDDQVAFVESDAFGVVDIVRRVVPALDAVAASGRPDEDELQRMVLAAAERQYRESVGARISDAVLSLVPAATFMSNASRDFAAALEAARDARVHLSLSDTDAVLRQAFPEYTRAVIDQLTNITAWRPEQASRVDDRLTSPASLRAGLVNHKYWHNALVAPLPEAPTTTLYCVYGVKSATERAYHMIGRSADADDSPVESALPATVRHHGHDMPTPVRINPDVSAASAMISRGVQVADGDGTVSLMSLGYMGVRGWRDVARNPGNSPVVVKEYTNAVADAVDEPHDDALAITAGGSAAGEALLSSSAGRTLRQAVAESVVFEGDAFVADAPAGASKAPTTAVTSTAIDRFTLMVYDVARALSTANLVQGGLNLMRGDDSGDHVDLLLNREWIRDVLTVAAAPGGGGTIAPRIHSRIVQYAARVHEPMDE